MPRARHAPADATSPARHAVGYLRRSTDRQEQSIDDQRTAVERYADERGFRLVRHYVDDGVSGTSSAGRRAFQRLIADAQRPDRGFSLVVCYDVKRFGRVDNDEAGYYRHILRTHGVEVHYASEGFSGAPGNDTDELLRPVKQWQARQESKDLAKVAIRGLVSKVRAAGGWWMGGAPPYGYDLRYESSSGDFIFTVRYQRDGSKLLLDEAGAPIRTLPRGETVAVSKRDRCRLTPGDPERVEVVRTIFRRCAEDGLGYKAITHRLNRDGVPSARSRDWAPHYSGRWSIASVRAILTNPAYTGDLAWNRRTDARFYRIGGDGDGVERHGTTRRRLEANARGDWIVVPNAHEPLVDRHLWRRAEQRRTARPASAQQTGVNPRSGLPAGSPDHSGPRARFLLSGLARCSRCGSVYEGRRERPGRATPNGPHGYACGGYIRQGRSVCSRGFVRQDELERTVIDAAQAEYRRFGDASGRAALRAAIGRILGAERASIKRERRDVESELGGLEATIRNLLDNITPANRAMVDRRLGELAFERRGLEHRVEGLDTLAVAHACADAAVSETAAFLQRLPDLLRSDDPEERQAAIRRCVEGVVIDRDAGRAVVAVRRVPNGPALPDRLPTRPRRGPLSISK
jgi:DNA invertase Pin-like site-specific DNA recombinase